MVIRKAHLFIVDSNVHYHYSNDLNYLAFKVTIYGNTQNGQLKDSNLNTGKLKKRESELAGFTPIGDDY